MKNKLLNSIILASILCFGSLANAFTLELKAGPPGAGAGGTNPVGLPPGAADLEIGLETVDQWHYSLGLVPGLLAGKRFYQGDFFGSLGAGLVFTINGPGLGPYLGVGFKRGEKSGVSFVAEFKQAIGYLERLVAPYALRIGASYGF